MREIRVHLSLGFEGAEVHDVIEVEEDATEEEIRAEVREWAFEYIQIWYDK